MAWSTVLDFSDPLSFQAAISTADLELLPTTRGQLRAEIDQGLPGNAIGSVKPLIP